MSSNSGDAQPPVSQKVVGAIFFVLPVAFIVVFIFWCWRRHQRSQEGRWAGLISTITPRDISLGSLSTLPELHSAHMQLDDDGMKLRWSDIKPVYASFLTNSPSEQPESSSGSTAQVGVLIRMPLRGPINTLECAHLQGVILLGSTNSLHVLE